MAGCNHSSKSLVEMTVPAIGGVITMQCDMCGAMLPREPIADDTLDAWFDGRLKVPHIDSGAWVTAIDRMIRRAFTDEDLHDLAVFAKVARR